MVVFGRILSLASLAPAFVLAGCGAGLVTGGLLGNRGGGGSPPPIVPPRLALAQAESPLVGAEGNESARILFVNNLQITSSDVRVELQALGVVSRASQSLLLSATPTLSRIFFVENHAEILARLVELRGLEGATMDDVQAELRLFVDDVLIGEPIPYLLRRQPVARLDGGAQSLLLSARGTTRIRLRVDNLLATEAGDIELRVITQDRDRPRGTQVTRVATDVTLQILDETTAIVTGIAPPSDFAGQALVSVKGQRAGQSTPLSTLFYAPQLSTAASRYIATDGGDPVTLIGEGLLPLDFSRPPPFPPDFDAVRISFLKGGRTLDVDPALVRREDSGFERLVFNVPNSPDGRPGRAEVALRVDLGVIEAENRSSAIFVYGHRAPTLGPRGALLTEPPRSFVLLPRTDLGAVAPQLGVLSASGGVPRLRLLVARDNGLFAGFGAEFAGGDEGLVAQRDPVDLCQADWSGNGLGDLLVVNRGQGTTAAHTLVVSEDVPLPPLAFAGQRAVDDRDAAQSLVGDFDGNGVADVVVRPSAGAAVGGPKLLLAVPGADGLPSFTNLPLGGAIAQHAPYDAMDVGDADGDGNLDLVFLVGGTAMQLVVAYGDGSGAFPFEFSTSLTIPGYTPQAGVAAVGVHLCGEGRRRAIAAVLAGGGPAAPPAIAVLAPDLDVPRGYLQPAPSGVLLLTGELPLVASVAGNLDRTPAPELVVAGSDGSARMLRLLVWSDERFVESQSGVDQGLEPMTAIRSLAIGPAVPAEPPVVAESRMALFVAHRYRVDGANEDRISTLLVEDGPHLVSPHAALYLGFPVQGIALGDFAGKIDTGRSALDAVVAVASNLVVLANDGSGGFQPFSVHPAGGAIPSTLVSARLSLPGLLTDGVVYLSDDGRIGVLVAGQTQPLVSPRDLRQIGPERFRQVPPAASSRIAAADIDADGVQDLVVLLSFPSAGGGREGEALIMLLRGKTSQRVGEFPWHLPDGPAQVTLTHGNVSALAIGDFVGDPGLDLSPLELAVTIPEDPAEPEAGNQVRFYRYDPGGSSPTDDRLPPSFAENERKVLIAGDLPEHLVATDLDGNGTTDLVIAANGDRRMRVFLNDGSKIAGRLEQVNIRAFRETLAGPPLLPPGRPTGMFLADINGDGVQDVVTTTVEQTAVKNQHVAFYTSNGTGALGGPMFVPHVRTGNTRWVGKNLVVRNADMHAAVGDLNRDGIPDVILGWSTALAGERNLMLLFGTLP